jgi:hypothetical protein
VYTNNIEQNAVLPPPVLIFKTGEMQESVDCMDWHINFIEKSVAFSSPIFDLQNGGGAGGGMKQRRTSPKVFSTANELRHNLTEAEAKL